jgi:hypothetical protein
MAKKLMIRFGCAILKLLLQVHAVGMGTRCLQANWELALVHFQIPITILFG